MTQRLPHPAAAVFLAMIAPLVPAAPVAPEESPGVRALIVDERLREHEVFVLAIEPDSLLLTDESGAEWRREIRGLIAVLPTPNGKDNTVPPSGAGVLELADGQRFPGSLLPTSSEGEIVRWVHESIGDMTFTLEAITGAVFDGPRVGAFRAAPSGGLIEDELLLRNGDVLRGFLAGLGDPVVFENEGATASIPADRVAEVRVANEPVTPGGAYVWLGDGTIAMAGTVMTDPSRERLEFTLEGGQQAVYQLGALRGIAFDSSRILPLAALTPSSQAPTGDRLHAEPIRFVASSYDDRDLGRSTLGLATIEFPGPMEVRYELPDAATRFGGTFALDEASLPWGDCVVTIDLDGRTLMTARLSKETLEAPFSVTASGDVLTIRVDPGEHGPILDRVSLERAIVLLRN